MRVNRGGDIRGVARTGSARAQAPDISEMSGEVTGGRGLALPVAGAAVTAVVVAVVGWTPATIALLVGAATWLLASHNPVTKILGGGSRLTECPDGCGSRRFRSI